MNKDSFILYVDKYPPIQGLSLEQKGMLLDAMFRFNMGEEVSFSDLVVGMAFAFFRASFERNSKKYQEVVARNRENGKKGGRPKNPTGFEREFENPKNPVGFSEPKKADPDPDPDPDPDLRLRESPNGDLSPAEAADACGPESGSEQNSEPEPDAESSAYGSMRDSALSEQARAQGDLPPEHAGGLGAETEPWPACPHQKIIALYHELVPELPKVRSWNDTRQKHLAARWRESLKRLKDHGEVCTLESGLDWWSKFFTGLIRASPLLMGRVSRPDGSFWCSSLDWMILPTNFAKILDRKYVERRAA